MTRPAAGSVERVTRNVTWLMFSQVFTWSLALVLALVLPRHLGPAAIGRLFFAQSLWALAAVVVAFGTGNLITKAVARRPAEAASWVGRGVLVRLALLVLAWPTIVGFLWLAGYDGEQVAVAAVVGLSASLGTFAGVGRAALQGLEEMQAVSKVDMAAKATLVVAVLALVGADQGVVVVAVAWVVSGSVALAVTTVATRRHVGGGWRVGSSVLVPTLALALPYVLFDASRVVYQQVDTVVISLLVDDTTVGWYGTADQIYGTAFFLPTVVLAAVFPLLARLPDRPPEITSSVVSEGLVLTFGAAVPLGVGLLVLGPDVARLVFGDDFTETGEALSVFGLALIPTYVSTLLGYTALALDRQSLWTRLMVGAAVATVVLDVVLVPWADRRWGNGAIGGALSYLITEVVIVTVGLSWLGLGLRRRSIAVDGAKVVAAGVAMAAVMWWLVDQPLPVPAAAGVIAYGVVATALGLADEDRRRLVGTAVRSLRPGRATDASAGGS